MCDARSQLCDEHNTTAGPCWTSASITCCCIETLDGAVPPCCLQSYRRVRVSLAEQHRSLGRSQLRGPA